MAITFWKVQSNKIEYNSLTVVPMKMLERNAFILMCQEISSSKMNFLLTCIEGDSKGNCIHVGYAWVYFTGRISITKVFMLTRQEKSVRKKKWLDEKHLFSHVSCMYEKNQFTFILIPNRRSNWLWGNSVRYIAAVCEGVLAKDDSPCIDLASRDTE